LLTNQYESIVVVMMLSGWTSFSNISNTDLSSR